VHNGVVVAGILALTNLLRWFDSTVIDGIVNAAGSLTRIASTIGGKIDSIGIDGLVNMTATLTGVGGLVLRKIQTGRVQTYVVLAVLGVMVFYIVSRFGWL
jgi:NADH-quinone oxidoreductase subunit L